MIMVSLAAKVVGPVALLAAGAVTVVTTTGPTDACGEPYNRSAHFGSVPTPAARRAAIKVATNEAGEVIDFYTGDPVPGTPDIDHVFSLKDSWPVTCAMTRAERRSFGNASINLVPTSASLNRGKGELGPAEWSPADRERACAYGVRFVEVADLYDLPIRADEAAAILSACGVTE